jgi:hypothetical protein
MKILLPLVVIAILCTCKAFSGQELFREHQVSTGNKLMTAPLRPTGIESKRGTGSETLNMSDGNVTPGEGIQANPETTDEEVEGDLAVTATMRNGEECTGRVLYANDTILVLWTGSSRYTSDSLRSYGRSLQISQIGRITVAKESHFWFGLASGFLGGFLGGSLLGAAVASTSDSSAEGTGGIKKSDIPVIGLIFAIPGALYFGIKGAVDGIDDEYPIDGDVSQYRAILPILRKRSLYPSWLPPEVKSFMTQ